MDTKEKMLDHLSCFDVAFHIVKSRYPKVYLDNLKKFTLEFESIFNRYIINGEQSKILKEYLKILIEDDNIKNAINIFYCNEIYYIDKKYMNIIIRFLEELSELIYNTEFDEDIYFNEFKKYKKEKLQNNSYDKNILNNIGKNNLISKYVRVNPVDSSLYSMSKIEFRELKLNNRLNYNILKDYHDKINEFFMQYINTHKEIESNNEKYIKIEESNEINIKLDNKILLNLLKVILAEFQSLSMENNFDKVKLQRVVINDNIYILSNACKILSLTILRNINYIYNHYEFDDNAIFFYFPQLAKIKNKKVDKKEKNLEQVEKALVLISILTFIISFFVMINFILVIGVSILVASYIPLLLSCFVRRRYIKYKTNSYKIDNSLFY